MKTLRECLLNEVRITIHNAKVPAGEPGKALNELNIGDTLFVLFGNGRLVRGTVYRKDKWSVRIEFRHNNSSSNHEVVYANEDGMIEGGGEKSYIVRRVGKKSMYIVATLKSTLLQLAKKYDATIVDEIV